MTLAGRQREMGLGGFPTVTLAQAREKARRHRAQVGEGADPIASRQAVVSAAAAQRHVQQTFTQLAAHYITQHRQS